MVRYENKINIDGKVFVRPNKSIKELEEKIAWEKGVLKRLQKGLDILTQRDPKETKSLEFMIGNHKKRIKEQEIKIHKLVYELEELKKGKSHKCLKRKIKKRNLTWIKEHVLLIIEREKLKNNFYLSKENIARELQVKECQVEQVFHILNRESIISQPIHHAPHDSQRDPNGFIGEMGWKGDLYKIL